MTQKFLQSAANTIYCNVIKTLKENRVHNARSSLFTNEFCKHLGSVHG